MRMSRRACLPTARLVRNSGPNLVGCALGKWIDGTRAITTATTSRCSRSGFISTRASPISSMRRSGSSPCLTRTVDERYVRKPRLGGLAVAICPEYARGHRRNDYYLRGRFPDAFRKGQATLDLRYFSDAPRA